MGKFNSFLISLLLLTLLTSCERRFKHEDKFFRVSKGWDFNRLPLIKPYEALNIDWAGWYISLAIETSSYKKDIKGTIQNAISLAVIDSVIFIYANSPTKLNYEDVPEAWFVIQIDKKTRVGFDNKEDYLNYLEEEELEVPELVDIWELWYEFDKTGTQYWFPIHSETGN